MFNELPSFSERRNSRVNRNGALAVALLAAGLFTCINYAVHNPQVGQEIGTLIQSIFTPIRQIVK